MVVVKGGASEVEQEQSNELYIEKEKYKIHNIMQDMVV